MLGLVDYGSSDEEELPDADAPVNTHPKGEPERPIEESRTSQPKSVGSKPPLPASQPASQDAPTRLPPETTLPPPVPEAAPQGPALGPSMPSRDQDESLEGTDSTPQSPYTTTRLSIRELTMPPVPNFDIPPLPPGSPPLQATKKFTRFLELKQQGIHFNAKLETSSALKNPNLLPKLREFAGIGEEDSLAQALPEGLGVPTSFPAWAYADQLNKTQQVIKKKKEDEQASKQRDAIDFVPATASGTSSRAATPGSSRTGAASSVAEKVMAGLDREKVRGPLAKDDGRRKDEKNGAKRSRFDRRSRSPSRKRSRSR